VSFAEHISIAGVVIAAIFAAYGVVRYRGGGSRLDLLVSLLIALGVALVSVVPQIGGIFTRLLGLEDRGFALLSIAVLLLFGLFLNLLGRVREAGRRNGKIVTGLAVKDYSERYLSSEERAEGHPGEVLIIVPAYDEEGGIQGVLRRIPDEVLGHEVKTVVIDDGSADRTADIARAEGVPVVSHVVSPKSSSTSTLMASTSRRSSTVSWGPLSRGGRTSCSAPGLWATIRRREASVTWGWCSSRA
jgi:hypothetical protein